ncbi:hypothetical protein MPTK1_6g18320 [Marchantia polymorpha subsp. ruderalis]|uniref:Uncharacterized protein n=2 Tax=Marchantia polymorpha TaxID=3197 RepID=A0AAF6BTC1_MARPO|nr:hypothetical protein MARPO_0038s0042 [Marchantia polymorpha]BBN15255.1 hypothetical protein Mp_6g18320 [Marchantia polymorpha subsp. ruderalis]|eukprot:PTQ40687.1 hypothetical protein MARPO_0038s0042 [Marchantia polymorpha]
MSTSFEAAASHDQKFTQNKSEMTTAYKMRLRNGKDLMAGINSDFDAPSNLQPTNRSLGILASQRSSGGNCWNCLSSSGRKISERRTLNFVHLSDCPSAKKREMDDEASVQSNETTSYERRKSKTSKVVISSEKQLAKRQKADFPGYLEKANRLQFQHSNGWEQDLFLWRFDVTRLLDRNLLENFLKRLKQVQLLSFLERTCEVIAPPELIANFILQCRVEWISSTKRVIIYDLEAANLTKLHVEISRESFAEALQLPLVKTNHDEFSDYSNPKFFKSSKVEWLGTEYFGTLCQCSQMRFPLPNGYADCSICSKSNPPESFWLLDEIKDHSVKDLIHFIGLWIHDTSNTSCLRRAAISSVLEALNSRSALQIWTQQVWTNFLSTLETLKGLANCNFPSECSFSTAGVISALLSGHTRKLRSWNRIWLEWERETYIPGIKICKKMISHMHHSTLAAEEQESLMVYHRRSL